MSLPTFESIKAELLEAGDNNACAPIAVSIVTGIPFKVVMSAFLEAGRKFRENAPNETIMNAIDLMGLKLLRVNINARDIDSAEAELLSKGSGMRAIVDSIDHWSAFDGTKIDDFIRGTGHATTGDVYFITAKT